MITNWLPICLCLAASLPRWVFFLFFFFFFSFFKIEGERVARLPDSAEQAAAMPPVELVRFSPDGSILLVLDERRGLSVYSCAAWARKFPTVTAWEGKLKE